MDNKTIAKFVVFIVVWINAILVQFNIKPIPTVNEGQVALWIAFAYSAYEWAKHAIKWMKDNWFKKQPTLAPMPVSAPQPTPNAVDVTLPAAAPVAQAQTIESTTTPEQPQRLKQQ